MIARQLEQWLHQVSEKPQIIHISGLRQTGKTTLMELFLKKYPHAVYYPLYDLVQLRKYDRHPEQWVLEIEEKLKKSSLPLPVFIDEIQKIPDLFQALQGLYQSHKGKIKFWIWGSSARPLKRQKAETLAGRILAKTLWPLSWQEITDNESAIPFIFDSKNLQKKLNFEKPRHYSSTLSRALTQTLLPEAYLMDTQADAMELLQSYQATYLENEIRRENLVTDIGLFEQFLNLAAHENSQIINHNAKASVLGISPHTVKNYYGILEDTFVCRLLPTYSKSFRVQVSKSPKVYFTDTGLASFIAGYRQEEPPQSNRFGQVFESFVLGEFFKQIEYHSLPWKLSYFRTKTGFEVDLIVTNASEKIAIEIKTTSKINSNDCKGLRQLMEMDSSIRYGILITQQAAPFEIEKNIYNFPAWNL
ncbi:MAG: ATP-binding protein [Deltaproteobacteria bacterium]|nr:ATP-binding protein [Deltaproteobacteria bacterium]